MSPSKKILSKQGQWGVVLIGGLCLIYVGLHWRDVLPMDQTQSNNVQDVASTSAAVVLEVPSIQVRVPVIYSTSSKESGIQTELQSGVVLLAGTAKPGEVGNAYIVGHSSNYKNATGDYNEVFKNLPNVRVGDKIYVSVAGEKFTYEIYETRVVQPTELWVQSQDTSGGKILTLQTSYPVGTADSRFVAIARLIP